MIKNNGFFVSLDKSNNGARKKNVNHKEDTVLTQTARAAAQQHQVRQAAMKQRIPHRTAAPAMQQVLVTGLQQLMKQMMQYRVKMTIVRLQNLIMS